MRCEGYVRVGLLVAIAMLSGALLITPSAAEEGAAKEPKAPKQKIYGLYNQLDLSAEQRDQISAIQKDYAEKIKQLREEEQQKIAGVLTPEQQEKLKQIKEEEAKKKAEKAASQAHEHPAKSEKASEHPK